MTIDTESTTSNDTGRLPATLSSDDYCSDEIFELDRSGIFHADWVYVCHVDAIAPDTSARSTSSVSR